MAQQTNPSRVLLVSRDALALRGVWSVCEPNSWQLETASSGLEAVERVESGDAPSLILLDLVPGDGEALHTLRWLRRVGPLTPVVVLAQPEDNQQMMEAVRLGAEDYVLKPLQAEGLERVLRRHMPIFGCVAERSTNTGRDGSGATGNAQTNRTRVPG